MTLEETAEAIEQAERPEPPPPAPPAKGNTDDYPFITDERRLR